MIIIGRAILIFIAALWAACANAQAVSAGQFKIEANKDAVWFNGPISDASADALIKSLHGSKRLFISSNGGDELAAIKVANFVMDNNVDVYIPVYCLSACANSILIAGRNVYLSNAAVIAIHGSALAMAKRYEAAGEAPSYKVKEISDRTKELYKKAGVSTDLLYCAATRIDLTSRRISAIDPRTNQDGAAWLSRYEWWAPPTRDLASFGVRIRSPGLDRDDQVSRAIATKSLGGNNAQQVRFEPSGPDCRDKIGAN